MNIQFGALPASDGEYTVDLNGNTVTWNALKAYTGVCPYVNSTLGHVHLSFGSNVAPMGTNSRFVYRGQFYVEADKAGTPRKARLPLPLTRSSTRRRSRCVSRRARRRRQLCA